MAEPSPDQAHALAQQIMAAAAAGAPLPAQQHSIEQWAAATNLLFDLEQFPAASYALRHLTSIYPRAEFVSSLSVVLDQMPHGAGMTEFHDDPSKELQVARRAHADTAIIFFCAGGSHRLGMPLNAFHRWAGQFPASLIYLRDFRGEFFLDGITAFGAGLEATLRGLRELVADLGARRLLCFGVSVGAFAALFYGLRLGAERVAGLCGAVSLEPRFNAHLRWIGAARRLTKSYPSLALDLVKEYGNAPCPPQTVLVYGNQNWDDRLHAEYMAPLSCVRLHSIPGFDGHNVVIELVRRREFTAMLERFVGIPGALSRRTESPSVALC
jgi:hypothetical protein